MTGNGEAVLINDEYKVLFIYVIRVVAGTLTLSECQETEGPQIWEINLDAKSTSGQVRFSRGHTYKWKTAMVASVASFWGDADEFVICADLKGALIV